MSDLIKDNGSDCRFHNSIFLTFGESVYTLLADSNFNVPLLGRAESV